MFWVNSSGGVSLYEVVILTTEGPQKSHGDCFIIAKNTGICPAPQDNACFRFPGVVPWFIP